MLGLWVWGECGIRGMWGVCEAWGGRWGVQGMGGM